MKEIDYDIDFEHKHFISSQSYAQWTKEQYLNNRFKIDACYYKDALKGIYALVHGNDTLVSDITKVMNKTLESIPTIMEYWGLSMAGAFPNVPVFLANQPESMFARMHEMGERAPIRIWAGVTSSWGISYDKLILRGAVLAAFAIRLSEQRPVIITPYVALTNYGRYDAVVSWDLQTSPLVLSEIAASLCDPNVIRHLGISSCFAINPRCGSGQLDDMNDPTRMPRVLGVDDNDLWLPCIHLRDPLLINPDKWLKESLAKYTSED